MDLNDQSALPQRQLRFSKGVVLVAAALLAAGIVLMLGPWAHAFMAGVSFSALGLGLFFTAGYYWACDNESCS